METTEKIKRPPIIFCSICGKEILQHEDFDYSQSKRHSTGKRGHREKTTYEVLCELANEAVSRGYEIEVAFVTN